MKMALDRERLLSGFLAAVKVCQIRYGGRTELASESDPRVAALCQCLEETLIHGLQNRISSKGRTAIKQVTGLVSSGLNLHLNLGASESDQPVLWWYVRELLTRHEVDRFLLLKQVQSDIGRGKAWLRSLLNEHSLERYMHIMVTDQEFLELWYEPWALLRDQERAAMLPNLAAGLDSILFAINIDNEAFDVGVKESIEKPKPTEPEPIPVMAEISDPDLNLERSSPKKSNYKKRKKKIPSQIVSFDDDVLRSRLPPTISSGYFSAPSTRINSPAVTSSATPYSNYMERPTESFSSLAISNAEIGTIECRSSSKDKRKVSPTASIDESTSTALGLQSYEQTLEDLLSDSSSTTAPDIKYTFKKKLLEKDNNSCLSGQSNISEDSLRHSDDNGARSALIPLKGGPSSLIPLSPDGESLFDFSGVDDVTSLRSSSQDELDTDYYSTEERKCSVTAPVVSSSDSKCFVLSSSKFSSLSHDELCAAILEISRARDTIQESRIEITSALTKEIEISDTLRVQHTREQMQHKEITDKSNAKINALMRENELLRHQLKKYVSAVQMLHRENMDGTSLPTNQAPDLTDYHDEALAYENKLIQVAEMHGELMEFSERLQRLLKFRETQVVRLKEELVDLRGPLPNESEDFEENVSITSDLDTLTSPRTLINIWIPTAFLAGPSSDTHHVYQIYISIKGDEWNVYRRFAQFYDLHKRMKKKETLAKTFDFPQKKTFGYKDITVVEMRRVKLQKYLRNLVNLLVASNPRLGTEPNKKSLIEVLPFISDAVAKDATDKAPTRTFLSRLSSSSGRSEAVVPFVSTSPQYNGL